MGIVDVDDVIEKVPCDGPNAPLKPSTLREWFSVKWDTPEHELIATTSVVTGLFASEVAHLASFWIEEEDGDIAIRLPDRARCVANNRHPCQACRRHRGGYFSPAGHSRRIPVYDDRLADLLSHLKDKQEQLGYSTIGRAISRLVDRSSIHRPIKVRAFRHTHGVAIAAKGYTRSEIHRWMGNDPDTYYGHMNYAKDYRTIAEVSPWGELAALGSGDFRQ